jgi:hypothetical protein
MKFNPMATLAVQNKFTKYKVTSLTPVAKQLRTAAKDLMKLLRKGQNQQQGP